MTHNSKEKQEEKKKQEEIKKKKKNKKNKEEKETKSNLSKTNNLTTKMQEESAVQYVAKLKAKLVADRKTRMAATKLMATKVVVKSQQVGHVKLPP